MNKASLLFTHTVPLFTFDCINAVCTHPFFPGKVLLDSTLGLVLVLAVDEKMHGGGGGVSFLF